jgi:hypothetical protein
LDLTSIVEGNCVAAMARWRATGDKLLVGRITNSIRPIAVASLLAKGEAQDALVPDGIRGDSCGKPWGSKSVKVPEDGEGWLETER